MKLKEIYNIVKDKELVVRKRMMSLIEKLIRYYNLEITHKRYKEIISNQDLPNTDFENKIKRYYDAYLYLMFNTKNHLRNEIMKNVYYIMFNKEIDEIKLHKIISKAFFLNEEKESIFELHLFIYEILEELDDFERTVISLIFLNYSLVKNNIPNIRLTYNMIKRYITLRYQYTENHNIESVKAFFIEILKEMEYQDKSYYKNLLPLSIEDVVNEINRNKEKIINDYYVDKLFIFGSILDRSFRIDSDVDMYVIFKMDISFIKKTECKTKLKEFLFNQFKRYIDLQEIFDDITDEILNQTTKILKVI